MSKRILITFGGVAYDDQVERQRSALAGTGIEHRVFDDAWLMRTPFYEFNKWIFDREPQHGFGFCSWKPYIVDHALHYFCAPGDVVMYLDGDTFPVADISCLFDLARNEGITLFEEQGCVNREWTKADCFAAMGVLGQVPYYEATQACGRFSLYRAGDYRVEQFLAEWQTYALNPMCTFHERSSVLPHLDDPAMLTGQGYKNSCEQSVLGNLAVKYGARPHRTPDQNGWPVARRGADGWHQPHCTCGHCATYKPDDDYPQLFLQQWRSGNILDRTGSRFANV